MVHVSDYQAKPHRQIEKENRKDRDQNQWVPLALDLNGQTAEPLRLFGGSHALDD